MTTVLHLMPRDRWEALAPGEPVIAPSLATDGFVHCTEDLDVLIGVANAFYRDEPGDFVVLDVDVEVLRSECRWEPPAHVDGRSGPHLAERFPHVYGPIDRDAISGVRSLRRNADGAFLGVV